MVSHKGQREGAERGNERRKLSCEEINHGDGEGSEYQGDDSEVSFGFGERIELMGENEEEGRMKIRRILFIKFYLAFKIISGVIEGMDFVHPKGFVIKGVKSQGKTYEEAKDNDDNFLLFYIAHNGESQFLYLSAQFVVFSPQSLSLSPF